jgi:hypothetical protein
MYAVCATQGLKAAGVKIATKTVADGTVTANVASCPSGHYPVGGGYNGYLLGGDTFWRIFLNGLRRGMVSYRPAGWPRSIAGSRQVSRSPSPAYLRSIEQTETYGSYSSRASCCLEWWRPQP